MKILLIICILALHVFAQTKPLIMKHADTLSVSRKSGFMLLKGNVHFVHDSVQFKTMRATWNRNSDIVQCEDSFLYTHPEGFMKANSGVYQKSINFASASGSVEAKDSAKTYAFWGERLQYDRKNGILTMPTKPFIHYYSKDKKGTTDTIAIKAETFIYREKEQYAEAKRHVTVADSNKQYAFFGELLQYNHKDGVMKMHAKPLLHQYSKDKYGNIDTVALSASRITFYKDKEFAEAFDSVKIVQAKMTVTCDTGYFDKKNNWLSLKGHPKCLLENHELTGDSMFLKITPDMKSIESALVSRNAHGIQNEPAKNKKPGSHTEAFGDTLYAEFDGQKLKRLYVNLNARGFFYEDDLPAYKNLMEGTRLDLDFKNGKMKTAKVAGDAQSTYFYIKQDRTVSGKNIASGDTIFLDFNPLKNAVKKLKVKGQNALSSGKYIDLERSRAHAKADSTNKTPPASNTDSTAKEMLYGNKN